jgi:hypothetical protein
MDISFLSLFASSIKSKADIIIDYTHGLLHILRSAAKSGVIDGNINFVVSYEWISSIAKILTKTNFHTFLEKGHFSMSVKC